MTSTSKIKQSDRTVAGEFRFDAEETKSETESENILVEYTGNSSLLIVGAITGKTYRFHSKGDKQLVDRRDAPELLSLSILCKA